MSIIQVSIKVESEEWKQLPAGKRSEIIRDFIKMYLAQKSQDIDKIDEEILLRKKQTLENRKLKTDTELETINATLDRLREYREEKIQEKLKSEKAKLLEGENCLNCKRHLTEAEEKKTTPHGHLCVECYKNLPNDRLKVYYQK